MEDILQGRSVSRKQQAVPTRGAGSPCAGRDSSNRTLHRTDPDSGLMVEEDLRKIVG